jgi:lipoprotein-anchoring transpeptidase ErfK/SrfK
MNATGRFLTGASAARRLGITAAAAAALTITAGVGAITTARPATPRPALTPTAAVLSVSGAAASAALAVAVAGPKHAHARHAGRRREPAGATSAGAAPAAAAPLAPLVLTALDRRECPAAATACVDLTRHITWLQADGRVSFGPVRMEPGKPGTVHATPRGTFQVAWKAGPNYMSNIYHERMPWATFFAAGGIAFHGGSLTHWSHGCVHLTVGNAHRYQEDLPIGAEVAVF